MKFLTPKQTVALLTRVDGLLATLGEQIAKVPLAGALNLAQRERVGFALRTVDGLRKLFDEERVRMGGSSAIRTRES